MKYPLILAALVFFNGPSARAAVLLSLVPQSQTAFTGSPTQVQLQISGLGVHALPSLGAFDLNIAFNPALISFTSLTFGDPVLGDQLDLSGTGSIGDFALQNSGLLEFYEISLDPANLLDSQQAGSFVLVTLNFKSIAPGITALVPTINSISDSQGLSFTPALQNGNITVVSAPEPSTIALFPFAGASIALLCFGRKRIQ